MAGDPVSDGEAPTLDVGGAEPKDSFDELLKRVVTGDHTPQLAPGTLLSDRFKVEKMIGAGGMGAVYLARDQTLDRDVAIKLHHTPGGAFRLRREAIAMARLAHPNVVTVFEVGEVARFPYVVMEYIAGTTLRAWLSEQPRSVAEIMDMLLAAGEGLSAAHDAGLLHRDIKPENVLVGSDGRARVGDFGLARELDSKDDPPPADSGSAHMGPMTQTGAVLGTPAYMAPEQLGGKLIDPRADQFAFCVTAWEALWGERPFRGASLDELLRAVSSGTCAEPPAVPKVPRPLRAALERGLSADPERRFPSMRALLDALRAPLRRRRKRVIFGASALGLVTLGIVGYLALARDGNEISCDEAAREATRSLPTEIVRRLRAIGAEDAAVQVGQHLNAIGGNLERSARISCDAEKRHEASPQLLAKSQVCREIAARIVRDMLRPPRVTRADVPRLVLRASDASPVIAACTSASYLASSPALPEGTEELESLIDARTNAAVALLELEDSNSRAAQPYIDRLERSPLRESPLVKPALLVIRAIAASNIGNLAVAEHHATDAYYAARTADDDADLVSALGVLLSLASQKPPEDPMVSTWLRTSIADAERMAPRTPWLAATLYLHAAEMADLTDDGPSALRYVARARTLAPESAELLAHASLIEGGVLMWMGHVPEAVAAYEKGIASTTELLGPAHPHVGSALADYAASLHDARKLKEALEIVERAVVILDASPDPVDLVADNARVNLAAILSDTGNGADARKLLETARAHYVEQGGEQRSFVANIDANLAVLLTDDHDYVGAIKLLEHALAIDEATIGSDRTETAEVLYNLAATRRQAGDLVGAQADAKRSAAIYQMRRPGVAHHAYSLAMVATLANQLGDPQTALAVTATVLTFKGLDDPQATAWAQLERGRALNAVGRTTEARALLAFARAAYAAVGLPARVTEIDRMLAKMR